MQRDHVRNLLPFDAQGLHSMLLTRAEPSSVGISPIGGFINPVYADDDFGLWVEMSGLGRTISARLSPGHFRDVVIRATRRSASDEVQHFCGPGSIALDGVRDHAIQEYEKANVTLRRDGSRILKVEGIMRWAVGAGMMFNVTEADV